MAEILMMYGERRKLAEKFSVSEVTVRDALKFRTRSNVANMIRKAALEMGGVLKGARTLREVMEKDENQSEDKNLQPTAEVMNHCHSGSRE